MASAVSPALSIPLTRSDEYSLQTTGNSESGRSPGGNLNVTTKSGTNQFHGDAYYYNRNEALAVASPFAPVGGPSLPLRNQNFGASVGGPVWHDHTFLFLLYEEQKFLIGESNTVTEPSPAYQTLALAELQKYGVTPNQVSQTILATLWDPTVIAGLPATPGNYSTGAPQAGYSHNVVAHLDHNFSDKSHLSAIWYFGQGYADAPDCVFVCGYLPEYFQTVPTHIQNYNTVWNYSISPSLSNQLAAGVNYFMQDFADSNHSQNPLTLAGLNTGASLSGAPQIAINGFDSIGITPTSGRNDIGGQIADTLSWTVGKHQFRFGLEYRREYIDLYYNWGARGNFNFGTGPSPLGPWANDASVTDPNVLNLADFMAGYAYTSGITLGTQERFIYTHTGSAFAEDSWQLTPKLNVNLGVRYDYQQPFYTNSPNLSIFDPNSSTGLVLAGGGSQAHRITSTTATRSISRRASDSPTRRFQGTVVRANFGMYYDQPAGQAYFGNIGIPNQGAGGANNNPVGTEPNESIVNGATARLTASLRSPIFSPSWGCNQPAPFLRRPRVSRRVAMIVSIYSVIRNFKTPYVEMFGLNVEQSWGSAGAYAWLCWLRQPPQPRPPGHQPERPGRPTTPRPSPMNATPSATNNPRGPYFSKYPNFGIINQINSAAASSYNALQVR